MKIKIEETGEINDIGIIDPRTGVNWVNDFIGNSGAFVDGEFEYNSSDNCYVCNRETFNWWNRVIDYYEKADFACHEYGKELDPTEKEQFNRELAEACCCDLEDQPGAMLGVLEEWENK